jgi:hypothetical protein
MAFAKKSGWDSIKDDLLSGNTQVEILVGLNFEITDPGVLTEWLKLKEKDPYRFVIDVAPRNPVFHPKVILVERTDNSRFAIIGSGNLTAGGLSTNVECGVLIEAQDQLDELALWQSQLGGEPLNSAIIEEYRTVYRESVQAYWKCRKSAAINVSVFCACSALLQMEGVAYSAQLEPRVGSDPLRAQDPEAS